MRQQNQPDKPISMILTFSVLFLSTLIYFGFIADYVTFYQERTALFVFSSDFLTDHLSQPGSFLIWISDLLAAFYHYPVTGAIMISAVICLTALVISGIISGISGSKSRIQPLMYGAILFFFHTNYQYLLYNSIGILIQLAGFYLAIKYMRGWLAIILFPLIYYTAGGFAWIFIIMCTLYLALGSVKKEWIKVVSLWACGFVMIYILKEFVLFQSTGTLLRYPFDDTGTGYKSGIFIGYSAIIAVIPLLARIRTDSFNRIRVPESFRHYAPAIFLLIIISVISAVRYDQKIRQYFHVEKLFIQNRFNEVVDYNRKNPSNNMLTVYLGNIALCETGRLNDQLFHFRQDPEGKTLFLKWEMSGEILRRGGYFYYTIGMINEAQRWAYENMIMKGLTPDDLRMLIRTEIITGNYETAARYNSILGKTLFYRKEAKAYDALLFSDKAVESDPLLGPKRKERIMHDFFSITDDPYINIERILSADSLNRKAFEYRLAYMLLRKDYAGIEVQLKKLGSVGFTEIPVHVGEAAEAYRVLNLGPLPDQGDLSIDPQIPLRFSQFLQTFQIYGNNLKSAEPALRQKFGNTFWYYAFYR